MGVQAPFFKSAGPIQWPTVNTSPYLSVARMEKVKHQLRYFYHIFFDTNSMVSAKEFSREALRHRIRYLYCIMSFGSDFIGRRDNIGNHELNFTPICLF